MLLIIPSRCYLPTANTPFDRHAAGARARVFKVHEDDGSLLEKYRALLEYATHLAAFVFTRKVLEYRSVSTFVWQISGCVRKDGAPADVPVHLVVVHPVVEFVVTLYSLMNMSFYLAILAASQPPTDVAEGEQPEELEHWLDLLSHGQILAKLYNLFAQTKWFAKARSYLPRPAVEALYAYALARINHITANEAPDLGGKLQLLAYAHLVASGGNRALLLLEDAGKSFAMQNGDLQTLMTIEQAKILLNFCLTITAAEEVRGWHEFATVSIREHWLMAGVKWREELYLDALCLGDWYLLVLEREHAAALPRLSAEVRPLIAGNIEKLKALAIELHLSVHGNYACLSNSTQLPAELSNFIEQRYASGQKALTKNLQLALTKNPFVGAHLRMPSVLERAGILLTQGLRTGM